MYVKFGNCWDMLLNGGMMGVSNQRWVYINWECMSSWMCMSLFYSHAPTNRSCQTLDHWAPMCSAREIDHRSKQPLLPLGSIWNDNRPLQCVHRMCWNYRILAIVQHWGPGRFLTGLKREPFVIFGLTRERKHPIPVGSTKDPATIVQDRKGSAVPWRVPFFKRLN